jgi:hypothetical protein
MGSRARRVTAAAVVLVMSAVAGACAAPTGAKPTTSAAPSAKAKPSAARAVYSLPSKPPADAVVLFDGTSLENWRYPWGEPAGWEVRDGAMTTGRGNIISDQTFTDAYIHVEFRVPNMPEAHGQERGNSGVYIQGRYEIQVLDSYGFKAPGKGDCGAIYGQFAPLVNACKPPLEWQTYDIIFRAARVDPSGKVAEPARITLLQNGMVIHNNVITLGPTAGGDANVGEPGPLLLQAHGSKVQYRNIWFVPLPLKGSDQYGPQ